MFNYINRDHIIGAVAGVALLATLVFMTGCSSECDVEDTADTAVTDTETQDTEPTEPTEPTEADYDEANARCEDAPCCGCCPSSNDYAADDGYGSPAADAWHDAHEYPEW